VAKAVIWLGTDAQARKRGDQTGLDTLVVRALNDVCLVLGSSELSAVGNLISIPPGEYDRKVETQRN
jgi:hypothetical protein